MSALRARFDLLSAPTSARAGRRAVTEVLTSWGLPPYAVDDAVLVVSELVTNAVLHAREQEFLALEITYRPGCVRVSLADGSAVRPLARLATAGDEGGRGMPIVDALSDRWGIEDHHGGKRIWFELDLDRTPPTAAEQAGDDAWDADARESSARSARDTSAQDA